jgi:hypothetical protein
MGRLMPDECDRCGGVTDWGNFGPDPDGSVGTTCECPTQRDDLALALRLLHRLTDTYKCGPPCNAGHGHEAWSWTDHDEPCPTAEAQALLARYGTRVTMSPEMEDR